MTICQSPSLRWLHLPSAVRRHTLVSLSITTLSDLASAPSSRALSRLQLVTFMTQTSILNRQCMRSLMKHWHITMCSILSAQIHPGIQEIIWNVSPLLSTTQLCLVCYCVYIAVASMNLSVRCSQVRAIYSTACLTLACSTCSTPLLAKLLIIPFFCPYIYRAHWRFKCHTSLWFAAHSTG